MLAADGVRFSYGAGEALRGVSARFPSGAVTGIIGPNGSGKSTLIKLLSRELRPAEGAVTIGGAPIRSLPTRAIARRIAVVPQKTSLEFGFTVREAVAMGRAPHLSRFQAEGEADRRIALEAMRAMRIDALADRSAQTLSGGEWQRVVVARALCQSTDILLLDEPVSSLDIAHQLEMLKIVRGFAREGGKTAVCVLHDLNLAAWYCDGLLLMKDGEAYATGSPEDVLTERAILEVYGVRADIGRARGRVSVRPIPEEWGDVD